MDNILTPLKLVSDHMSMNVSFDFTHNAVSIINTEFPKAAY